MEINPEQLQALLDLLVTSGVEEFEGYGFHVRFTPALFTKDKEVAPDPGMVLEMGTPEGTEDPRSIWEVPKLWPGGKPPTFPGK